MANKSPQSELLGSLRICFMIDCLAYDRATFISGCVIIICRYLFAIISFFLRRTIIYRMINQSDSSIVLWFLLCWFSFIASNHYSSFPFANYCSNQPSMLLCWVSMTQIASGHHYYLNSVIYSAPQIQPLHSAYSSSSCSHSLNPANSVLCLNSLITGIKSLRAPAYRQGSNLYLGEVFAASYAFLIYLY